MVTKNIDLTAIAEIIRERTKVVAVYVFGSVAIGRNRPDSDIDIAMIGPHAVDSLSIEELKEKVSTYLQIEVDLIDFVSAPPPLQAEIMRYGKKIRVWDQYQLATIFMNALRCYQKLNEERLPLLEKKLGKDGWKRLF
jgi:predicted nucleotidyltransferase